MPIDRKELKTSLQKKVQNFREDENGLYHHGIFGLPFDTDESSIVLFPIPWEVTVSYGQGAANAPDAILKASWQIDLYDEILPGGWKNGISMTEIPHSLRKKNNTLRTQASEYLEHFTEGKKDEKTVEEINNATAELNAWVENETAKLLDQGKLVGVIGGDHSTPFGFMNALARRKDYFSILQIDAHADLRNAYEGFEHSHASIMYNALTIPQVERIVQVGVRDLSKAEFELAANSNSRVMMFTDEKIKSEKYIGVRWDSICDAIISNLTEDVYISFDIDGLMPYLCPNTGTPVPGGLEFEEAVYLLKKVVLSGRRIIGFDLCEVSPGNDDWDANVGSRILYKLCLLMAKSNGLVA